MNAGRLRHRVSLQKRIKSRNGFGESVIDWHVEAVFWAEVKPITGKESFVSKQFAAETSHELWCRFRRDINASDRILDHRGHVLTIKAILDIGGLGKTLKLLCQEVGI